jgi:hypothetical protein
MCAKVVDQNGDHMEDRGWQQMKELLDLEMPVKMRRRLFWLPWAGGIAAVLLMAFLYRGAAEKLQPTDQGDVAAELSSEPPTVALKNEAPLNADPIPTNENALPLITQASKSKSQEVQAEKAPVLRGSPRNLKTDVLSQPAQPEHLDPALDGAVATDPTTEIDGHTPADPASDQHIISDPSKAENTPGDRKVPVLDRLALTNAYLSKPWALDTKPLQWQRSDLGKMIQAESRNGWGLAAAAGLLAESSGHEWGYDIGARLHYRFANILVIETGAHYWSIKSAQTYTQQGTDMPWSPLNDAIDFLGSTPGIGLGADPSISIAYSRSPAYLRWPLAIRFFPEGHWQPYAGIEQLFVIGTAKTEAARESTINRNSYQIEEDFTRSKNFAWKVGFVYQPKGRFYLDLSYTHANDSHLRLDVIEGSHREIHRYFRLGLGYQIIQR